MPSLSVRCRAQYLTEPVENMRRVDYDATHLVKAVKGLDLNPKAFSEVTIDGQRVRLFVEEAAWLIIGEDPSDRIHRKRLSAS